MDTYRFNYGGSIQIDLPWNMKLSTEIDEQCRRGYAQANMNTNELIWGFQISQSILPKKTLVISLKAVDVLSKHSDISRTITTTSRTDTRTSTVHSYFLATLSYRFRQFGGKSGGKNGAKADSSKQGKQRKGSGADKPQKKKDTM